MKEFFDKYVNWMDSLPPVVGVFIAGFSFLFPAVSIATLALYGGSLCFAAGWNGLGYFLISFTVAWCISAVAALVYLAD